MNTLSVDILDPPALRFTVDGAMDTLGPLGLTVAVNATAPEKPLMLARLIVDVSLDPTLIVSVVGLALIVKSATPTEVTVKPNVVVLTSPPLAVPVIVTVTVPVVAVALAVNVRVDEQVGLQFVGENAAVTAEGRPEAENVTL